MSRTKAVAYVRVSLEKMADEGVSLDAQEERLLSYAQAFDIDIIEVVRDAGASAKDLGRRGLQRALALLDTGAASALLVTKLDRLTRSVKDLAVLLEQYFASGRASLISLGESVDTRTAGGRLVLHVLTSVAQWERESVGERTREALQHLRRSGVRMGAAPLGLRYGTQLDDEGRHVIEEVDEELRVVGRIHELRVKGLSMRAIAAALTAEGWRTKRAGKWHPATVQRVLRRAAGPTRPARVA